MLCKRKSLNNSLRGCFLQGHQGAAAGTITNPGDMDAFKRQQAMVQAGRARIVDSCLSYVALFPPRLLCFLFVFFSPSNCFCF